VSGAPGQILDGLQTRLTGVALAQAGIGELRAMIRYLDALGVPETVYRLNFAMVRGLEYYTGPIFETTVEKPKAMPSITGGGRYDNLIGMFSPVSYPATGTSLGIERIIEVMDELAMFPPELRSTTSEALVTIFSEEAVEASLSVASALRADGIKTTIYFDYSRGLRDQIGYASAKGIPYAIIVGPDEIAAGTATIRRLGATAGDSQQRTVDTSQVAAALRKW
jgi:histidyl-tRNA synthetase